MSLANRFKGGLFTKKRAQKKKRSNGGNKKRERDRINSRANKAIILNEKQPKTTNTKKTSQKQQDSLLIDQKIKMFNTQGLELSKIHQVQESEGIIFPGFFFQNSTYCLRFIVLQIFLVSLPQSPVFQISLMAISEIVFILTTFYWSKKYFKVQPLIEGISRIVQSLALFGVYIQFYFIFRKNEVEGSTKELQRNSIYLIMIGICTEYFFVVVKLVMLFWGWACKKKERKDKKTSKVGAGVSIKKSNQGFYY